jgi:hypothetical protein
VEFFAVVLEDNDFIAGFEYQCGAKARTTITARPIKIATTIGPTIGPSKDVRGG